MQGPEVVKTRKQEPLWSTPSAALVGEALERLAVWCDARKRFRFEFRHASRRWFVDIRRGNEIIAQCDGELADVARFVNEWVDGRVEVKP